MSAIEIIELLAILSSVTIFMIAHFVSRHRDRVAANREVYQRLELASIDLFRFEADHPDLVRALWQEGEPAPAQNSAEDIMLQDFVCQYLNLFEMAYRLRKDDIMSHDVFGSWVVWYLSLAGAPAFPRIWAQLRCDYVKELASIMDEAVSIHRNVHGELAQRKAFFSYFAKLLGGCPAIENWHGNQSAQKVNAGTPRDKTEAVETHLTITDALIEEIVPFMVLNMDTSYISHGEIMEGRAIDTENWSPHLATVLRNELAASQSTETLFVFCIRAQNDSSLRAIGLCEVFPDSPNVYAILHDLIIDKDARGQGLGTQLLHAVESTLLHKGISRIYIESGLNNDKAHSFFHKAKFHPISTVSYKDLS